MKKYIRIDKNTTEEMAVEHLESLWGKVYKNLLKYNWFNFIKLDNFNDIYYTYESEKYIIEDWYEEIILEETFELWEQISCSDTSKVNAIESIDNDIYKYYYTWWKTSKWLYITENEDGNLNTWKYIAKIPDIQIIHIWDKKYNQKEVEKLLKDLTPIK